MRDAENAGKPFTSIERVGDWADLVAIDPQRLDTSLDSYHEADIPAYGGLSRTVNRDDQTVDAVFVSGREVFRDGQPTEILGRERTGGFLRADGRPRNVPRPVIA